MVGGAEVQRGRQHERPRRSPRPSTIRCRSASRSATCVAGRNQRDDELVDDPRRLHAQRTGDAHAPHGAACARLAEGRSAKTGRPAWTSQQPVRTVGWARGPADLRDRERVRRHVHVQGPAPAEPRRGRALPVPQGRQLGPQQQRLPPQRRPALPRRRQPPRVRHARVRRHRRAGHPRQGGGAGPRGAARSTPSSGSTTRASPARSTCSRTTPTRPATPTAATRTTWSAAPASSAGWPTC